MSATLTLDLFRPSILDPIGDTGDHHHDHDHHDRAPGHGDRDHRDDRHRRGHDHLHHHETAHSGGGLTLDELLVEVWEGLSAHRTVACPACGAAMTPRYSAGPAPVGGRCTGCGTTIA